MALCGGDFKDTVKEQPGSASVVQGVNTDRDGVGYSGIGYRTSGVRAIPLSKTAGQAVQKPDYANVASGRYPLARFLYVYVNKNPSTPLEPLTKEFLTYVLSKPGQEVVVKDGYYPLSAAVVERERAKLE